MSIELGGDPDSLVVHLSTGGRFESTLVLTDENDTEVDWPDGTEITLQFIKSTNVQRTWSATVVGAEATFAETVAEVAANIAAKREKVRLYLAVAPEEPELWASGKVEVHA